MSANDPKTATVIGAILEYKKTKKTKTAMLTNARACCAPDPVL
jgi:hypothetical protein